MVKHPDDQTLVELIMAGESEGQTELYSKYARGLTTIARRYCPNQAEDCVHDTIITVVTQIREGRLENPKALAGYLMVILKRITMVRTEDSKRRSGDEETFQVQLEIKADHRPDPERRLLIEERANVMHDALRILNPRDQEILRRFYLDEQDADTICKAMDLTETQFRLYKSRAKKRLEDFVQKRRQEGVRRRGLAVWIGARAES